MRLRFGIRLSGWLFRNAGIFVLNVSQQSGEAIVAAVDTLRGVLIMAGREDVARAIVCEKS